MGESILTFDVKHVWARCREKEITEKIALEILMQVCMSMTCGIPFSRLHILKFLFLFCHCASNVVAFVSSRPDISIRSLLNWKKKVFLVVRECSDDRFHENLVCENWCSRIIKHSMRDPRRNRFIQ